MNTFGLSYILTAMLVYFVLGVLTASASSWKVFACAAFGLVVLPAILAGLPRAGWLGFTVLLILGFPYFLGFFCSLLRERRKSRAR